MIKRMLRSNFVAVVLVAIISIVTIVIASDVIVRNGQVLTDSTVTVNEYTLPAVDGNDGQVLTTDGSGNLSWQDADSGTKFDGSTVTSTLGTTGSWVDGGVDLSSALTGGKRYLCYLKVTNTTAGTLGGFGVRASDSTDDLDAITGIGISAFENSGAYKSFYIMAISGTDGKFDYYNVNYSVTVTLMTYTPLN